MNKQTEAMKRFTRDDTEHGVEYYRADEVDALMAEQPATTENNGGKTGWPPGLLQDDCKGLSKWLSNQPDAKRRVREALAKQPAQQEPHIGWLVRNSAGKLDLLTDLQIDSSLEKYERLYKLYTSPPAQRKPLTAEQIDPIAIDVLGYGALREQDMELFTQSVRAIEAAHDIKEQS